jgi:hypothetical protein
MQRRRLLQLGLTAAAVLAIGGGAVALLQPGLKDGRLTPAGRDVFEAVARGVLDGSLPPSDAARRAVLVAHLQRLDDTVSAFPAHMQAELSQLLALLAAAPGRATFAGLHVKWPQATPREVQEALQSMRLSSLALRQQAYHALRDLTNAAYFADASSWAGICYPGPRAV